MYLGYKKDIKEGTMRTMKRNMEGISRYCYIYREDDTLIVIGQNGDEYKHTFIIPSDIDGNISNVEKSAVYPFPVINITVGMTMTSITCDGTIKKIKELETEKERKEREYKMACAATQQRLDVRTEHKNDLKKQNLKIIREYVKNATDTDRADVLYIVDCVKKSIKNWLREKIPYIQNQEKKNIQNQIMVWEQWKQQ